MAHILVHKYVQLSLDAEIVPGEVRRLKPYSWIAARKDVVIHPKICLLESYRGVQKVQKASPENCDQRQMYSDFRATT
jgi:hypothetical protein